MTLDAAQLFRTLGSGARLWALAAHEVADETWLAFSGEENLNYNLACSQSASGDVLARRCLEPMLAQGHPGVIMLRGPGLAAVGPLADAGWVVCGALPLMLVSAPPTVDVEQACARPLVHDDLPEARQVLATTYGLDAGTVLAAIPDQAVVGPDMHVWGIFDGDRMAACCTFLVEEDGMAVGWSMATLPEYQRIGYGRRLIVTILKRYFQQGMTGMLIQGSVAGQRLYRELGFCSVEFWQLWSRPRWTLGT